LQLLPSGSDYLALAQYLGRYTTLVDVRFTYGATVQRQAASSSVNGTFTTLQRNNILQITDNVQVPPTVVFQGTAAKRSVPQQQRVVWAAEDGALCAHFSCSAGPG
jgi:hypothetical protein